MGSLGNIFDWAWPTFRQTGWKGWTLLALAIFAGLAAGRIAQTFLRSFGKRLEDRGWRLRGMMLVALATPLSIWLLTIGLSVGLAGVVMSPELRSFSGKAVAFLFTIAIAWFLFNLIDLLELSVRRLTSRTDSKLDDAIIPLIRRTAQVFLLVIFVLFTAQNIFNADIGAWLAGLGVAGLAVSLAAQDTIKNVFGSITIYMDRMFQLGDRIVFDGHDGGVEEIGLRSTRIRTLEGNLAIVPNSKFVDSSVLNIGRRNSIRRVMKIGITYDTPPDKVEQAVQIVKEILAEPEIARAWEMEKFPPRVAFDDLAAASLTITVFYWHHPADYWAFLAHSEQINLRLMRRFAEAGIEFAFPTQTLYLAGDPNRKLAVAVDQAEQSSDHRSPSSGSETSQ